MSLYLKLYGIWRKHARKQLSATRTIAVVFAWIILTGALLLSLPVASRDGVSCGFRPALFTATSATCVTGLVLYDTWTQWSGFGQTVILCLIEIGGLGFMSAMSLVVFLLRRQVGLKQRILIAQALSLEDLESVVHMQKWVLLGSFGIETLGALVLLLHFWPEYGFLTALKWGIFHAVSAFCNAGFDIFGCMSPGSSLLVFQSDPVVLLTLASLVILGGLGFLVWEEIARIHKFRKFSVYTRLVLLASLALLILGTGLICLLEWNNPGTLGPLSVKDKILNAVFQSATVRTAGFASVNQAALTDAGKVVSMVLMMIGGSSGSTAGGIKTVTMVVLLLFLVARARGKNTVCVFHRTVPQEKVLDAVTVSFLMVLLAVIGGGFICATSPVGFTDGLYESVSALATVGLTAGVTTSLSIPAQLLMILYMYFGRVGILTISLGFLMGNQAEERFRYAQTNILIG